MQSTYMKIPPSPTPNDPAAASSSHAFPINSAPPIPSGDDYSDYYAFLRDALASLPSVHFDMPDDGGGGGAVDPTAAAGQKRGRELEGSDGGSPSRSYSYGSSGSSGGEKKPRTGAVVAQLVTSLAMLDEQERAERREWEEESRRDLALCEANHRQRAQAMADYYDCVENHYADAEESEGVRAGRARVAVAAATAAASSANSNVLACLPTTAATSAEAGPGQHHHHRRLWVKSRSRAWWDSCDSPDFPEEEFRRAFRMGRSTFEMICQELRPAVEKEDTMLRAAIPVRQRVAVCIWRLATGEPLRLVSKRFGLGISTCHKLVLEVCAAIKSVLMPRFLQWPAGAAEEDAIKARFEAGSGIPNVVGAMYTTHIPIIAPKISVAAYFNKRHTERNQKTSYSITIQGVVDPDGVFTDVCIGWPGSMSDEQVLANSALYQRAESGMLRAGQWVVGGAGYPLLDWVLVPYAHQNLTWTQHAFNEKIGEVQRTARDAFARLKGRWKCLQKRTEVKLQDLPGVLGACCVLHNICEMRKEEMEPELTFDLLDDEMAPENGLRSMASMQARESIAHNLLHRGLGGTAFF